MRFPPNCTQAGDRRVMRHMAFTDSSRLHSDQRRVDRYQRNPRVRLNTPSPRGGGYQLRTHNIRFNSRPRARGFFARYDSRQLLFIAAAIVVVFLLVFGVVSCVRSCTAPKETVPVENEADSRVAAGVSEELTTELTQRLDQDKKVRWIAKHADEYPDERIIELALREPAAIDFVRNYPGASHKTSRYNEEATKGTYPALYTWDERWGNMEYGGEDLPLGLTGSGPTCLSMAYIGLTGRVDRSPADMAELAQDNGWDTGNAYCTGELFTSGAGTVGLLSSEVAIDEDTFTRVLENNVIVCRVKSESFTPMEHYVLIVGLYDNGSVRVLDPTSTSVSTRQWDVATVVSYTESAYALSSSEGGTTQ